MLLGQGPVAERTHLGVEVGADPRHLRLGDPGVRAEGLDQVVDLAGRDAVQVGLHHHGEQRLVDPAAALEQRREERAGAQFWDPQLQVTRRRGQDPGAVPVSLRGPFVGALVRGGADRVGELRLDQGLVDRLHRSADTIADISDLERIQDFEQGRLVQGHRVAPLYVFHGRFTQRLTRWPLPRAQARRRGRDLHHQRGRNPRWDGDQTGRGVGSAVQLLTGASELIAAFGQPDWVAEQTLPVVLRHSRSRT